MKITAKRKLRKIVKWCLDINIIEFFNEFLISLLIIYLIKFFSMSYKFGLLSKDVNILIILFGVIIILIRDWKFNSDNGFGSITNSILLLGGLIYFLSDSYILIKLSVRLFAPLTFFSFILKFFILNKK